MRHPLRCEHNFTVGGQYVCRVRTNTGEPECAAPSSWHWGDGGGGNGAFDGCNAFGWEWGSGADVNKGNVSHFDQVSHLFQLQESATVVAISRRGSREGPWMYVGHPYLN
jgi:hypothetical protein